jgi:hypothetical protein
VTLDDYLGFGRLGADPEEQRTSGTWIPAGYPDTHALDRGLGWWELRIIDYAPGTIVLKYYLHVRPLWNAIWINEGHDRSFGTSFQEVNRLGKEHRSREW